MPLPLYILRGFRQGFRIGFDYPKVECRQTRRNLSSAVKNAAIVDKYLQQERSLDRVVPVSGNLTRLQLSPIGIIPKPHQPGKWRLMVDLSSPRRASVNDGIDGQLCSLSYTRLDDAARRIVRSGRGTLLAKVDLQSAYRIVPVHRMIARFLVCVGGCFWTRPCRLAYAPPPRFSRQLRTRCCGHCTTPASLRTSTTWTIFCFWSTRLPRMR